MSVFDPDLHMRTADVRDGMKGYGLSVFKGTRIERFDVEVLSVLRNSEQIGTDVVLIKASGANLEFTGPISGMSGSPVYIHCDDGKDRLLGAFAFGWPGLKEPIAGVQPIEAMLTLESAPRPVAQDAHALATDARPAHWDLATSRAAAKLMKQRPRTLAELFALLGLAAGNPGGTLPGGLQPLGIPLSHTGLSPRAAKELSGALGVGSAMPMLPRSSAGAPDAGPSSADRVEPGSALLIPVLLGDLNLVATGTCTTVIGDRVFAFGHPLTGEGASNLPIAAGEVSAVIPTHEISFKLGSPGKVVGTLATDGTPGIAGTIGAAPQMIPMSLRIRRGDEERVFRFQAARHRMLTLAAIAAATQSATDFAGAPDAQGATRWDATLRYKGGRTLRLRDVASNNDPFGAGGLLGALAMPLVAIDQNPFAPVTLESLEATIEIIPPAQAHLAALEQVSLPRLQYRPGETVNLNLTFRLFRGGRVQRSVNLQLPKDLPPGEYPLTVNESVGALAAAMEARPFEFDMASIDDLFTVLNEMQNYGTDAIYVRLDRPEQVRVAVGRAALSDLPNSRTLLLAESGRSEVRPYAPALRTKLDLPYVVTEGEAQAQITVVRP